ncbi:hypothetical protein N7454_009657 [Penicillium verhagenii]|nr:hypothetical protein N7454_009657 [Penicillium verhagenii]
MQWRRPIPLMLASIEYALGSHSHKHLHGHGYLMPHAEKLEPRDVAWLDQISPDMLIEFRTLTTTVYEDCAPTNTIYVTTTVFEDILLETTHLHLEPTYSAISQLQPPTARGHNNADSVPEYGNGVGIDMTAPPREVVFAKTTGGIHTTTTVVASLSGFGNATATVSLDVTEPSSEAQEEEEFFREAAGEEDTERKAPKNVGGKKANIDGHLVPMPTPTDPAPGLLPKLPGLPQLLPATALPNLNSIGQALDLNGQAPPQDIEWTSLPKDSEVSTDGFGGRSAPKGSAITYQGNIGIPWGSNIIAVSPTEAHRYNYVAQFSGANTEPWTVTIWNKVGPDGKMDGWYGHSALTFVLAPGETKYVAFDEDSEGAWGAAPGTHGLPTDQYGGYTSTWGEFSFGDLENSGWSGWDVSAIQAQIAHHDVQGMKICQTDGKGCSSITPGAKKVVDAYTQSERHSDGIGGAASPGPVRLAVSLDYQE